MTTIEKLNVILEAPVSTSIIAYKTWLKEILKEQDKYKWHDLRKNHKDVPKDCVLYVYTKLKNGRYTVSLWNHYEFPAYPEGTDLEVIAWREIEPFEEDE